MRPLQRATLPILTFACTGLLVLGAVHVIARAQATIISRHVIVDRSAAGLDREFVLHRDRVASIAQWYAARYHVQHPDAQVLREMVNAADRAFIGSDRDLVAWWLEQLRGVTPPVEMTS